MVRFLGVLTARIYVRASMACFGCFPHTGFCSIPRPVLISSQRRFSSSLTRKLNSFRSSSTSTSASAEAYCSCLKCSKHKLCVQGLRRPAVRWSTVNSFVSNLEPLELTRSRTISLEVRAYRSIGTKRMSLKPTCLCAGKLLMCKRARVRVWTAERPATCCGISKSASSYPLGTSTSSCSSLIVSSVRLEQRI